MPPPTPPPSFETPNPAWPKSLTSPWWCDGTGGANAAYDNGYNVMLLITTIFYPPSMTRPWPMGESTTLRITSKCLVGFLAKVRMLMEESNIDRNDVHNGLTVMVMKITIGNNKSNKSSSKQFPPASKQFPSSPNDSMPSPHLHRGHRVHFTPSCPWCNLTRGDWGRNVLNRGI